MEEVTEPADGCALVSMSRRNKGNLRNFAAHGILRRSPFFYFFYFCGTLNDHPNLKKQIFAKKFGSFRNLSYLCSVKGEAK